MVANSGRTEIVPIAPMGIPNPDPDHQPPEALALHEVAPHPDRERVHAAGILPLLVEHLTLRGPPRAPLYSSQNGAVHGWKLEAKTQNLRKLSDSCWKIQVPYNRTESDFQKPSRTFQKPYGNLPEPSGNLPEPFLNEI